MTSGRWWAPRVTAAVMLSVGLQIAVPGSAAAVPEYMWRDGHFVRAGAPVYPEPADGWSCHLFADCRDAARGPDDPAPAWRSAQMSQPVLVECQLGEYYKLREPQPGWVLEQDVRAHYRVELCHAGDF